MQASHNFDIRNILKKSEIFDDSDLNGFIIDSLSEDIDDIANAIVHLNKNKVCFVDGTWYTFDVCCWEKNEDFVKHMLSDFTLLYKEVANFVIKMENVSNNKKDTSKLFLKNLTENIKDDEKNGEIISSLKKKLSKNYAFDMDTNLFAFTNGVFDFEKMKFRKCLPSDMIKNTCGYDYKGKYNNRQKLMDDLLYIFSDEKTMEFFLAYVVASISGLNDSNLILILKCVNSRYCALFRYLLMDVLGNYAHTACDLSEIIPNKKGIKTDLSYLTPIRFLVVESIEYLKNKEVSMLVDFKRIKSCNKNKIEEIDIKFSTLCMCDNDPLLDEGLENNTAFITISNDKFINRKINKNDFFLLLIEYMERLKNGEKMIEKEYFEVDERTNEQKICGRFLEECTIKSDGRERSTDVFNRFEQWCKEGNNGVLQKNVFFNEMKDAEIGFKKSARFGKSFSSAFIGIKLKPSKISERVNKIEKIMSKNEIPCVGIDGVCPVDNKSGGEDYDNYCIDCFTNLFPDDPRLTDIITDKTSKERRVVNYVCTNHTGIWYHNIPLSINFDGGCCTSRRRIDLYQLFENTMLCIEVDENQHKYYPKYEEFVRYNELLCDMTCKYIFIRYNPDTYKKNGNKVNTNTNIRLKRLSNEISKQIERIQNNKNDDMLEIIHLYYDE